MYSTHSVTVTVNAVGQICIELKRIGMRTSLIFLVSLATIVTCHPLLSHLEKVAMVERTV